MVFDLFLHVNKSSSRKKNFLTSSPNENVPKLQTFPCFNKEDFIKKNTQKTPLNYHYLHNIQNPPPHRIQTLHG